MDDSLLSHGSAAQPFRPSPASQAVLIAFGVVYIAAAILWIGPAVMAALIFDMPFVSLVECISRNLVFWASMTWPVVLVVAAVKLFKQVRSGAPNTWRTAGLPLALPLINVALFCLGMAMAW